MSKGPAWIVPLVELLTGGQAARVLWIGPALGLERASGWVVASADVEPPAGPFGSVCVAAVEGELEGRLRRLRAVCGDGALVCLLLPERVAGVGARVARVFDPLGRAGRAPRTLAEMCAALLSMGAEGVACVRDEGQLRAVYAHLPSAPRPLDSAFDWS